MEWAGCAPAAQHILLPRWVVWRHSGFAVMSGLSSTADIRLRYIEDATGDERHSAYPQPSEGRSSHYEATGDYLNSRCVFYKEEPKPATYGAP